MSNSWLNGCFCASSWINVEWDSHTPHRVIRASLSVENVIVGHRERRSNRRLIHRFTASRKSTKKILNLPPKLNRNLSADCGSKKKSYHLHVRIECFRCRNVGLRASLIARISSFLDNGNRLRKCWLDTRWKLDTTSRRSVGKLQNHCKSISGWSATLYNSNICTLICNQS